MYEITKLKNGITVASRFLYGMSSASIGIWVAIGSRHEPVRLAGVSHFLEHAVFKGTSKRECEELKQAVEGVGGTLNAFTAEEATCYLAKVLGTRVPVAVDVLSDIVLNARLAAEDIEREKGVVIEEIRMYHDLPSQRAYDELDALLWPGQSLGRPIAGFEKTVSAFTRKDLRGFRDRYYAPKNIFVVAAGNVRHQGLVELTEEFFAKAKGGTKPGIRATASNKSKFRIKLCAGNTEQTHMAMGLPGLSRQDPDRYALTLLHVVLGANMSSRLFREVREKRGLAYEIGTHLKMFADTGAFMVHAGVEFNKTHQAIGLILKELDRMTKRKIGDAEFRRARDYYTGQVQMGLEDTMDHMVWMGENLLAHGRIRTPQEILAEISQVTPDDVFRVAKKVFKQSKLCLSAVGPFKDKDRVKIEKVIKR